MLLLRVFRPQTGHLKMAYLPRSVVARRDKAGVHLGTRSRSFKLAPVAVVTWRGWLAWSLENNKEALLKGYS